MFVQSWADADCWAAAAVPSGWSLLPTAGWAVPGTDPRAKAALGSAALSLRGTLEGSPQQP